MDLDEAAERTCRQVRSPLNDTNDCAWVTVPASSPALRAPASGLRDLTPAPSPKPDAGVPLKHSIAATEHGTEGDEMSEFPLDRGHPI
jgi:hypothetical protein